MVRTVSFLWPLQSTFFFFFTLRTPFYTSLSDQVSKEFYLQDGACSSEICQHTLKAPSTLTSTLRFRRLGDDSCLLGVHTLLRRVEWVTGRMSPLKAQMDSQKAGDWLPFTSECLLCNSSPHHREVSSQGPVSSALSTCGLQHLTSLVKGLCAFCSTAVSLKSFV